MKKIFNGYIIVFSFALLAFNCTDKKSSSSIITDRTTFKVALVDSMPFNYDDEARRLTDNMLELFSVLASDNKDCNRTYILDPSIFRLDIESQSISLKTEIKKGGAKDVDNPKVIGRLIQKHLKEIDIPKVFITKQKMGINTPILVAEFIRKKAPKDSILVYIEDGSTDKYLINNRTYIVFTSIEEIRSKMLSILCENPKANFTLLINPPALSSPPPRLTLKVSSLNCQTGKLIITPVGGDGSPITYNSPSLSAGQSSSEFMIAKDKRSNKKLIFSAIQNGITSKIDYTTNCPFDNGSNGGAKGHKNRPNNAGNNDLVIVKGSEGCDICTRYYTAIDASGRTRQITERNSTNCCPCGKTIEMKGHTYRMECDGVRSNRLALVE